jgi:hypothetical protein
MNLHLDTTSGVPAPAATENHARLIAMERMPVAHRYARSTGVSPLLVTMEVGDSRPQFIVLEDPLSATSTWMMLPEGAPLPTLTLVRAEDAVRALVIAALASVGDPGAMPATQAVGSTRA